MPLDPGPIQTALNKLLSDRSDLDNLYAAKATTATALASAQNADSVAGNALSAGVSSLDADKKALHDLIDATVNTDPPAPAQPASAPAPASPGA